MEWQRYADVSTADSEIFFKGIQMPEPSLPQVSPVPEPSPVPQPVPAKAPNKLVLYILGALTLVAMVAAYTFFNKYHSTQLVLNTTTKTVTTQAQQYTQLKTQYDNYRQLKESKSSYRKTPFLDATGKPVFSPKGLPLYVYTYLRDTSSSTDNTSGVSEVSAGGTTTVTNTDTVTHETKTEVSGQLVRGYFWLGVPTGIFQGHLDSLSLGYQHEVFLGFTAGLEASLNNLDHLDFAKDLRVMILLGHGTP